MLPDWPGFIRFKDALAEANSPEFYPIEWLEERILHGLAWPIIGVEAAVVCEIRVYPGGARVGHVIAAAGDMVELVNELAPKAEAWARMRGCTTAEIDGRIGWQRALREHGWQSHQLVLLKEL